jgi:hypothetical protein
MMNEFAQNERAVNPTVQMPRTVDVLLEDDVARRKGTTNRIDDKWRQDIRRRMNDLGINQEELIRLTGASKGAISEALSMKLGKPTSRWVESIHHALNLKPPDGVTAAVVANEPEPPRVEPAAPTQHDAQHAGTSRSPAQATMRLAEALAKLPPGGFDALDDAGKRDLIKAIVDGVTPDRLNETFAHLIGLKR